MENSYFIFTKTVRDLLIERFHICTWEFKNDSSLIEFGMELSSASVAENQELSLLLFVPWLTAGHNPMDFFSKLKDSSNAKFIFNDSVNSTQSLDGGNNRLGVTHTFKQRQPLAILPAALSIRSEENLLEIKIDLTYYLEHYSSTTKKPNIYVRFAFELDPKNISTRKNGINKSSIIYDLKLNEQRNIPDHLISVIRKEDFCKVDNCFCFQIIPNNYDVVFYDKDSLVNVRTLEYEAFTQYLSDSRIEPDDLIVLFNKKKGQDSYVFFSIFAKERIGRAIFISAFMVNIFCGILLFVPSFRNGHIPPLNFWEVWTMLPVEIYIVFAILIAGLAILFWPAIKKNFLTHSNV